MADLAAALVGTFIDAAVRDPAAAEALLRAHPELLNARWIHDETVLHFLAVEDGDRRLPRRTAFGLA